MFSAIMGAPDAADVHALVARIFPTWSDYSVERVHEGASTYVYRLRHADDLFYLRIFPEQGASFVPEAQVHELLRQRGVKVPEVVYVEHLNEMIGHSVMVTTEIAGEHVGRQAVDRDTRNILIAAGRDLAIINSIPVDGFGWICDREDVVRLEAEHSSFRAFAFEDFEARLTAIGSVLDEREIGAIRETIDRYDGWFDVERAWLAHGDFDVTHIFQQNGRYTGIIDFGEIRGGDPFYDLGHFRLHDGETLPDKVLPYLLEGYRQVTPFPPDYEQRIAFSSLLIGIRWLARMIEKYPGRDFRRHQAVKSIRQDVADLGLLGR